MRFLDVIRRRKLLFLNIFLFMYVSFNLLDGERGLISYMEKIKLEKKFVNEKTELHNELKKLENKNYLLSENLDFDYVDTLLRKKLKLGNKEEILIKLNE